MQTKRQFKNELYDRLAHIGNALASGRRLELLDLLAQGERSVEALANETDQPIANVSQHLQVLRRAQLVEVRRSGTYAFYRLADDAVLELWMSVVKVDGIDCGIIPRTIGGPYAVLVAEQLRVSGARVIIGLTSAGRVLDSVPLPSWS